MGSSASSTTDVSRPARDTALRQLLRPLEPYLERREVTELAVNRPGEICIRSAAGWACQEIPELTAQYLEALTTAMAVHVSHWYERWVRDAGAGGLPGIAQQLATSTCLPARSRFARPHDH